MKKLLIIMTALVLVLSTTGCSKPDPEKIYKDAYEKMAALESCTSKMNIEMTMDANGSNITLNTESLVEKSGDKMHMIATASALTASKTVEGWLIDGVYYGSADGSYATMDASESDFEYMKISFGPEVVDSYGYSSVDGKDVVTLTLSDEKIAEALFDSLYMFVGVADFDGFTFSPIEVTISKDGYIEKVTTTLNVANESGSIVIKMISIFSGYNNTTVNEPDYTLWENNSLDNNDSEYVPSEDVELDITKDDEAKLLEAGYTVYSDGYYVNAEGTVDVDTKYKVLYFIDGDLYAEYDWEYQIGYTLDSDDNYCRYYFSDDTADETCTDEMIGLLKSTRDIFLDLYYSIH